MPSRLDTFSTDATISFKKQKREKDAKIMQTKDKLKRVEIPYVPLKKITMSCVPLEKFNGL